MTTRESFLAPLFLGACAAEILRKAVAGLLTAASGKFSHLRHDLLQRAADELTVEPKHNNATAAQCLRIMERAGCLGVHRLPPQDCGYNAMRDWVKSTGAGSTWHLGSEEVGALHRVLSRSTTHSNSESLEIRRSMDGWEEELAGLFDLEPSEGLFRGETGGGPLVPAMVSTGGGVVADGGGGGGSGGGSAGAGAGFQDQKLLVQIGEGHVVRTDILVAPLLVLAHDAAKVCVLQAVMRNGDRTLIDAMSRPWAFYGHGPMGCRPITWPSCPPVILGPGESLVIVCEGASPAPVDTATEHYPPRDGGRDEDEDREYDEGSRRSDRGWLKRPGQKGHGSCGGGDKKLRRSGGCHEDVAPVMAA
jgi:hypothetical protein